MKLYHVANNRQVAIGDTVQRVDGAVGKVRGWEQPQAEDDTGYVIVRFGGMDPAINVEPAMLNMEWRECAELLIGNFDVPKREAFRAAYDKAVKAKAQTFNFDDNVYLVDYAKYLLQYLDVKLGPPH